MRTEIRNDKKYFICECGEKEYPDMIALKMMERNQIEGLLPFKYIKQEDEKYFRYEAGKEETLAEWITKVRYRRDVTELLESLLHLEEEIEAYLLKTDHICMDMSFITVMNNTCKAVYIPSIENMQGSLLDLVYDIISSVKYALDEDFSYLFDLQNAFGRKDIKNSEDLKKWLKIINGEEKAEADAAFRAEPLLEVYEKAGEETASTKVQSFAGSADSLEGIFGDLGLGGKEKKSRQDKDAKADRHIGFLAKNRKKGKQENGVIMDVMQNFSESVQSVQPSSREIINDLERGDATVMVDIDKTPVLHNIESAKEYLLKNSSYTIGSGAQADIVVQNNKTVSRTHARIFQNNDSWYIEDLGSTNGTCVSGEMLRKMEPYKLENGARIQLSNENYVFQMN